MAEAALARMKPMKATTTMWKKFMVSVWFEKMRPEPWRFVVLGRERMLIHGWEQTLELEVVDPCHLGHAVKIHLYMIMTKYVVSRL